MVIVRNGAEGYRGCVPASKTPFELDKPSLTWRQMRNWINANADELLEFAKLGFWEQGRGLVILAGSPTNVRPELAIQCRYIMPEEISDIENEAVQLAQELVDEYNPQSEFVVVTIDASSRVTSALVSLDQGVSEPIH